MSTVRSFESKGIRANSRRLLVKPPYIYLNNRKSKFVLLDCFLSVCDQLQNLLYNDKSQIIFITLNQQM